MTYLSDIFTKNMLYLTATNTSSIWPQWISSHYSKCAKSFIRGYFKNMCS